MLTTSADLGQGIAIVFAVIFVAIIVAVILSFQE